MASDWVTEHLDRLDHIAILKRELWWLKALVERGEEPVVRNNEVAELLEEAIALLEHTP